MNVNTEKCHVCGWVSPFNLIVTRDGRRVCWNVQACTERVLTTPAPEAQR